VYHSYNFTGVDDAQKAALWCLYGKTKMSSLSSQLLLHLNIANRSQLYNGQGNCPAICIKKVKGKAIPITGRAGP
jgi:hypothetical protein